MGIERAVLLVLGATVGGLAGCDAGEPSNESSITASTPLDFGEQLVTTLCERYVSCNVYPNVETCRSMSDINPAPIIRSAQRGTVTYDAQQGTACIEALRAASCSRSDAQNSLATAVQICGGAFRSGVAPGGACVRSFECTSRFCDTSCSNECCEGVCEPEAPLAGLNEDCSNARCAEGAYCRYEGSTATCALPLSLPEGAACNPRADDCQLGTFCWSEPSASNGFCKKPPQLGEACPLECFDPCSSGAEGCEPREFCASSVPCDRLDHYCEPATKTCQPRLGSGSPCMGFSDCAAWLECFDGSCRPRPPREPAPQCNL